jgi:putative membrane protein
MALRLLLALSAALAACAPLESPERAATRDAQLVRGIVQANLAEIAAGKLAVSKARTRALRQHGQRMVREHTVLQAEASELKSAQGVPLPTRPDAGQEAALKKLEAMSGESFERAYLEQNLKHHAEILQLLERTASRATDPALRAYAERAIPRVRQHLELAGRLAG